ncbi:ATP-binding protein [Dioszegia hungarica]|uniref:Ribokinase n=1 Tax=Dioszegia hungarica TaxID=4972 RepID=A0AA38HGI3_9TREE|nr:ATP-binding protein [Dioszegia hungarica]KAI9639056.1 ATP binding protein [Dioszegia hungarica]
MSSSTPPQCLVRGSINIDEFFHLPHIVRPGETISSSKLSRGAGGKGANQANAVARAGGNVVMDGCIGEDGIWVRDGLERAGVDVGRVMVVQEQMTGRAIIQLAEDGENSIVLHKGANYHTPPSDTSPSLSGITHLLLQNEIPLPSTLAYLRAAHSGGVTSIFNPSPMLSGEKLRQFPWACLSWLIVNEGELTDLLKETGLAVPSTTGSAPASAPTTTPEAPIASAARAEMLLFRRSNADLGLICTLGARGILYLPAGSQTVGYLPAATVVNGVVDTTGAGDCFAGYFAAGLMRDEDLETTLRTCLTACAMCVEKAGAMESVPSRAKVEARIA